MSICGQNQEVLREFKWIDGNQCCTVKKPDGSVCGHLYTEHPTSQGLTGSTAAAPAGLNEEAIAQIVTAVRDGVTAGLLATRRSRVPTTLPDTPEEELPAEDGLLHDHKHIPVTQAAPYTLDVGSRHAVDTNFYLGRLLHNFYRVNGDDRFEWIKTRHHILLKDGKRFVRKTGVSVFDARNLLLELDSTNYRYDQWMAKRNNGEFENFGYSSFATPPEK